MDDELTAIGRAWNCVLCDAWTEMFLKETGQTICGKCRDSGGVPMALLRYVIDGRID